MRAVAAFPSRPARLVVPYSVDIGPDVVARALASSEVQRMADKTGFELLSSTPQQLRDRDGRDRARRGHQPRSTPRRGRGMTRQVHKSALVLRPAPMMFDLIEAAEDYPRFLPWCAGATILARDDSLVAADLDIVYRGFRWRVGTRNPKRRPEHMAIHLVRGPFRHFEGRWRLTPLADHACKVEFDLTYEFDHPIATQLAGPVFARIADTVVDAFVKRAHSLPAPPTTVQPAAASPSAATAADAGALPAPSTPAADAPAATPAQAAPPSACDAA